MRLETVVVVSGWGEEGEEGARRRGEEVKAVGCWRGMMTGRVVDICEAEARIDWTICGVS